MRNLVSEALDFNPEDDTQGGPPAYLHTRTHTHTHVHAHTYTKAHILIHSFLAMTIENTYKQ